MSIRETAVRTAWRSRPVTARILTLKCDLCGVERAGAPGKVLGLLLAAEAAGWLVNAPGDHCPACHTGGAPGPRLESRGDENGGIGR